MTNYKDIVDNAMEHEDYAKVRKGTKYSYNVVKFFRDMWDTWTEDYLSCRTDEKPCVRTLCKEFCFDCVTMWSFIFGEYRLEDSSITQDFLIYSERVYNKTTETK